MMVLFRMARIRRIERRIEYHLAKAEFLASTVKQLDSVPHVFIHELSDHLAEVAVLRKRRDQLRGA